MAADPNGFDYFRAGEPLGALKGSVNNLGLDYFRAGEILAFLIAADPELTGRVYKRFVGPLQLAGSAADLYTVPASTVARVLHIHASNPSGSPVDMTLSIGADAAATRVYDDYPVEADATLDRYDPYDLAAGEKIQGWAGSAAAVVLTVTGWEQPE